MMLKSGSLITTLPSFLSHGRYMSAGTVQRAILDMQDMLLTKLRKSGMYEAGEEEMAPLHWKREISSLENVKEVEDGITTELRKDASGRVLLLLGLGSEPVDALGYAFVLGEDGLGIRYEGEVSALRGSTLPETSRIADVRLDSRGLPVAFVEDAPVEERALHTILSPAGRRLVTAEVLREERNCIRSFC